jgi:hypothetical protein
VRTRPRVSKVTGSLAAEAEASAGTEAEPFGVTIALIAMALTGTLE